MQKKYKNPEYHKQYRKTHKEQRKKWRKNHIIKLRLDILNFLGNKCVKCGFSDWRALQIDHINGGGRNEIKRLGYMKYYKKIKENPQEYQILCANCNWIKRYENNELIQKEK